MAAGSALTDYAVFSVLLFAGTGVIAAQMTARIAGGVFSFILNKFWSFETQGQGRVVMEGRRFLVLYAVSYVLALSIVYALVEVMEFPAYPSKISADVVCFLFNFVIMRTYVFSGSEGIRDKLRSFIKRA